MILLFLASEMISELPSFGSKQWGQKYLEVAFELSNLRNCQFPDFPFCGRLRVSKSAFFNQNSRVSLEIFWPRCVMLRQWLPVTLSYNNWNWVSTTTAIYFHRLIPTSFHLFDNRFSVPAISALKIVSFFTQSRVRWVVEFLTWGP